VAGATPILMFVGRSLMKPGDVVLSAFAIVAGGAFGVVGALIVARRAIRLDGRSLGSEPASSSPSSRDPTR
jgi:hypothetical protein